MLSIRRGRQCIFCRVSLFFGACSVAEQVKSQRQGYDCYNQYDQYRKYRIANIRQLSTDYGSPKIEQDMEQNRVVDAAALFADISKYKTECKCVDSLNPVHMKETKQ